MEKYKFNVGDLVRPKQDIVKIGEKLGLSYDRFKHTEIRPTMKIVKRYKNSPKGKVWYEMESNNNGYRYAEEVLELARERNEI